MHLINKLQFFHDTKTPNTVVNDYSYVSQYFCTS